MRSRRFFVIFHASSSLPVVRTGPVLCQSQIEEDESRLCPSLKVPIFDTVLVHEKWTTVHKPVVLFCESTVG